MRGYRFKASTAKSTTMARKRALTDPSASTAITMRAKTARVWDICLRINDRVLSASTTMISVLELLFGLFAFLVFFLKRDTTLLMLFAIMVAIRSAPSANSACTCHGSNLSANEKSMPGHYQGDEDVSTTEKTDNTEGR